MSKILFIAADGLKKSGVPNVMLFEISLFVNRGHTVDLIYFKKHDHDLLKEFRKYCRNIYYFGHKKPNSLLTRISRYFEYPFFRKKLKGIIKENGGYDAVHSFAENRSYPFFKVAKKHKIHNLIVDNNCQLYSGGNFFDSILMKMEKKFLRSNAIFKAPTLEVLIKSYGKNIRYKIINNPYDFEKFSFNQEFKEPQVLTLCQVASYSSNKNQLFSLDVFDLIKGKDVSARLFLLGFEHESGYLKKIKARINELGIKDVSFFDPDYDVKKLFDSSSCLLLPSHMECNPIVLLEAQACGLRCYCSNNVSLETNRGNCVYLSLEKPHEWAEKILLDKSLGLLKRNKCDMSYNNLDYQIEKYKDLYNYLGIIL